MPAQINYHELQWLDAYRQAIRKQHPDAVVKMLLFSREGVDWNQHDYTDLNLLLVVSDDAAKLQNPPANAGLPPLRPAPYLPLNYDADRKRMATAARNAAQRSGTGRTPRRSSCHPLTPRGTLTASSQP